MNDAANLQYALNSPNFGILNMPVLFLQASEDNVCETVHSRLADPMRSDCTDLTEIIIQAGHELHLEKPHDVNLAIDNWLKMRELCS